MKIPLCWLLSTCLAACIHNQLELPPVHSPQWNQALRDRMRHFERRPADIDRHRFARIEVHVEELPPWLSIRGDDVKYAPQPGLVWAGGVNFLDWFSNLNGPDDPLYAFRLLATAADADDVARS